MDVFSAHVIGAGCQVGTKRQYITSDDMVPNHGGALTWIPVTGGDWYRSCTPVRFVDGALTARCMGDPAWGPDDENTLDTGLCVGGRVKNNHGFLTCEAYAPAPTSTVVRLPGGPTVSSSSQHFAFLLVKSCFEWVAY